MEAPDTSGERCGIVDGHRDGQRFVLRADEKLTAFLELESVIWVKRSSYDFT